MILITKTTHQITMVLQMLVYRWLVLKRIQFQKSSLLIFVIIMLKHEMTVPILNIKCQIMENNFVTVKKDVEDFNNTLKILQGKN